MSYDKQKATIVLIASLLVHQMNRKQTYDLIIIKTKTKQKSL
jgi:hypothetical protein